MVVKYQVVTINYAINDMMEPEMYFIIKNMMERGIVMSMANRPTKRQLREFDDLRKITKQLMKENGIKTIKFVPVHVKYNKKENNNEKERD